ncbi:MAG: hypothetical protein E7295_13090 [Lachnospiraceae bacterium]|nr:hypothetical protein [Lachnospiraceae bacterium]
MVSTKHGKNERCVKLQDFMINEKDKETAEKFDFELHMLMIKNDTFDRITDIMAKTVEGLENLSSGQRFRENACYTFCYQNTYDNIFDTLKNYNLK